MLIVQIVMRCYNGIVTTHVTSKCPFHEINCQFCFAKGERQLIEGQHKAEYLKYPIPCTNECEVENIPHEDMDKHKSAFF